MTKISNFVLYVLIIFSFLFFCVGIYEITEIGFKSGKELFSPFSHIFTGCASIYLFYSRLRLNNNKKKKN